jgi:hypothetical protein
MIFLKNVPILFLFIVVPLFTMHMDIVVRSPQKEVLSLHDTKNRILDVIDLCTVSRLLQVSVQLYTDNPSERIDQCLANNKLVGIEKYLYELHHRNHYLSDKDYVKAVFHFHHAINNAMNDTNKIVMLDALIKNCTEVQKAFWCYDENSQKINFVETL